MPDVPPASAGSRPNSEAPDAGGGGPSTGRGRREPARVVSDRPRSRLAASRSQSSCLGDELLDVLVDLFVGHDPTIRSSGGRRAGFESSDTRGTRGTLEQTESGGASPARGGESPPSCGAGTRGIQLQSSLTKPIRRPSALVRARLSPTSRGSGEPALRHGRGRAGRPTTMTPERTSHLSTAAPNAGRRLRCASSETSPGREIATSMASAAQTA